MMAGCKVFREGLVVKKEGYLRNWGKVMDFELGKEIMEVCDCYIYSQ